MSNRRTGDPRLSAMIGDVAASPWPPVATGERATLAALVQQFDRSPWLDADVLTRHQHDQLVRLAAHHAVHSPGFAGRLAQAGLHPNDLGTMAGLQALPVLSRAMIQDGRHAVPDTALPPQHLPLTIGNTSGSTGEPVLVPRTALSRLHWLALTVRMHLWAEPDFNGAFAAIRANMTRHGHRNDWGAPLSLLFPTGSSLLIDLETDIDAQLAELAAFGATSVLIYPSNLVALIEAMDRTGITLPTVRLWRTIGEKLTPDIIEHVATASSAPIVDCYSAEEIGYLAMQCPDVPSNYHVMSETVIVEIVDERGLAVQPGEIGTVLVTDLHNLAMPLIRYAIGDHAMAGEPCPCGRSLPVIRRILGRTRNMIVKPDGTRHWPLTGYKQFRDIAPIRQYQFIQHAIDHIEVRLVTERPLTAAEEAALTAHLHWKLRHPFAIDYRYFEGRLPTRNGKFEEFLSHVS